MASWILSPIALYAFLAIGAVGIALSLPRPRISPQLIGGIIAAAGFGGLFLYIAATDKPQPIFFYIFALIAILSGIRVISHPRPVYAALYFIFTILSSSVLYLLMGAEFMAFALLIIYAGAILITYLFVIMLATQAPTEDQAEALSEYDSYSREPVLAVTLGFVLLACLTGYMARAMTDLRPRATETNASALLNQMPRKALDALAARGVFEMFDRPTLAGLGNMIDPRTNSVLLGLDRTKLDKFAARVDDPKFNELFGGPEGARDTLAMIRGEKIRESMPGGGFGKPSADVDEAGNAVAAPAAPEVKINANATFVRVGIPKDLTVQNVELVGFALVARHPMALELAGIILLMAMLGAVVLARKQVELGEAEKIAAAARHAGASAQSADTPPQAGPRGYGDVA
ncbi:MAG: NADH-quinone oxidoreductase subunit J [Phycisphaerales bacterium]